MFLPYMASVGMLVVIAAYIYDPTMKLLLYAALPDGYKTSPLFWLCLAGELHFLLTFIALAVPAWQLQVISVEILNTSLQTTVSHTLKR